MRGGEGIRRLAFPVAVVALLFAAAGTPRLAQAEDEADARMRFKRGQELFDEGKYLDAAREFEAGFASAPRPLFLLNIAHSYRRAQEFKKAKRAYELLLRIEPNTPFRVEVEGLIKTINDALESAEPIHPLEPTSAPGAAASPPAQAARPLPLPRPSAADKPRHGTSSAPAPVALGASERDPERTSDEGSTPIYKNPWLWAILGSAVVAGTVVALMRPSGPSCQATSCFRE